MPYDAQDDTPDDALLLLYANGDRTAARVLTLRLTPKAFGHAFRVLGDRAEAEDVAQEAMLRLWKMAPDWRQGEAKVTTWLYRVVANLCTDRLRKKRGVALDDASEPEDDAASAADQLQDRARVDALQERWTCCPNGRNRLWCCGTWKGWATLRLPRLWISASKRLKAFRREENGP